MLCVVPEEVHKPACDRKFLRVHWHFIALVDGFRRFHLIEVVRLAKVLIVNPYIFEGDLELFLI